MSSDHPTPRTRPQARVWKYGDHINTDVIFPGKYAYTVRDPDEMATHALEDLDPHFATNVQPGDILIAGTNFGNGSSREQAVTCLIAAGVRAVVAVSFGRIWYRNAINNGLPAIILPEAVEASENGSLITIDFNHHTLTIDSQPFSFPPFSETAKAILAAGGLIPFVQQKFTNS